MAVAATHAGRGVRTHPALELLLRLVKLHGLEAAGFAAVFGVALGVRLYRLGTVPRILTGDELENLQTALHVAEGTGPGLFGFDWKPSPIFGLYPLAWTVQVFGHTVTDLRTFPVILSLLTILLFYTVARKTVGAPAALAAMLLLSTNLWVLNFSRTAWDNMNSALFAIGACWASMEAVRATRVAREAGGRWRWLMWWALAGVFCALGLYGYFSGRFVFISVTLIAALAIVLREAPWRRTLAGLCVTGGVCAVLFAPMAWNITQDWEKFNARTDRVNVFKTTEPYEGTTNGWLIVWKNVWLNYRGLVLNDGSEVQRGFWGRYHPDRRAPLELIGTHLFLAGLVVAAIRFRRTYHWWTFFAPPFIAEVFSRGTPDLARAVIFAPFYFLYIALFFDEALRFAAGGTWPRIRIGAERVAQAGAFAAIAAVTVLVSVRDIDRYFGWQAREQTQLERLPGIDYCEWDLWYNMAVLAARSSVGGNYLLVNEPEFSRQRRQHRCSAVVNRQIQFSGGFQ